MSITVSQHTEVVEHLRLGKKVNAIKAMRAFTGLGLKDAKAEIDVFIDTSRYLSVSVVLGEPWWKFW